MSEQSGLAAKVAVLEERMNTKQAEYKTDIAMLAADNARLETEIAKRDTRQLMAIAAMIGIATAIIGIFS